MQGGIDEDAPPFARKAVELPHMDGIVPRGQDDPARIGGGDGVERRKLGRDLRIGLIQCAALPGEDHEIGTVAQGGIRRPGPRQAGKVLAPHGPRDGQDHRFFRREQARVHQRAGIGGAGSGRAERNARRDGVHPPGRCGVIRGHLPVRLVGGRDHDRVRLPQGAGFAPAAGIVGRCAVGPVEREGVRRVEQGNARGPCGGVRHLERIGEMGVDHVGAGGIVRDQAGEGAGEGGKLRLHPLLREIAGPVPAQAQDTQAGGDLLHGPRVVRAQIGGVEGAGDDVHPADVVAACLSKRRAKNIGDVTAGIGGDAVTRLRPRQAATEGDVHDMHGLFLS